MTQRIVLVLALGCAALSDGHDPVKILMPRASIVMAGMRGTSIHYQAFVTRHAANRWVQMEVWTDGMRVQSSGWSLEGEEAAQTQPSHKPLVVHVHPGRYVFRVLACASVTEDNECANARGSAVKEIRVCGGEACG